MPGTYDVEGRVEEALDAVRQASGLLAEARSDGSNALVPAHVRELVDRALDAGLGLLSFKETLQLLLVRLAETTGHGEWWCRVQAGLPP